MQIVFCIAAIFVYLGVQSKSSSIDSNKARKFACKALKGKGAASGIRLIYAYYEREDIIEFIEIYYKGSQENEDRERILRHYGKSG